MHELNPLPAGNTKWLGATLDKAKKGTNFAFYTSADATRVQLCLFDQATEADETAHYDLTAKEEVKSADGQSVIGYIWHGFAAGINEGQLYGFRVHGPPYDQSKRHFYNPAKLLVDPCARAVTHAIHGWDQRFFHHKFGHEAEGLMDDQNSGRVMPKARVVDWQALQERAKKPGFITPHADTTILEMHVRNATMKLRAVPKKERATYKAMRSRAYLEYLKARNITSVELMPIESFGTDTGLCDRGLKQHWGYMPMCPTAPHPDYAATKRPEEELVETIRVLRRNKIEVILDIVPNHTLEGGDLGPMLNLKGMDPTLYLPNGGDYTGAGNMRDFGHPMNQRLLLEELKYWKSLGVSGFRIDLAMTLGRSGGNGFDHNSAMMKAIYEDPELSDMKFYGEPWDLRGHEIGNLHRIPKQNTDEVHAEANDTVIETNGKYSGANGVLAETNGFHAGAKSRLETRNRVPEWLPYKEDHDRHNALVEVVFNHHPGSRGDVIRQLSGGNHDRYLSPLYRVNKLGSHDGPFIGDRVRHGQKNNRANKEDNRDGNELKESHVWYTDEQRQRVQRYGMAFLALSQGPVLIKMGDERDHTADGNTNPFCQPNELTDMKWGKRISKEGRELMAFQERAFKLRRKHDCLRRARFFTGTPDEQSPFQFKGAPLKDVTWLHPTGRELEGYEMNEFGGFAMMLSGDLGVHDANEGHKAFQIHRGKHDQPMLVLVNPGAEDDIKFTLPKIKDLKWRPVLNSEDIHDIKSDLVGHGNKLTVGYRSIIVFEGVDTKHRAANCITDHLTRAKAAATV